MNEAILSAYARGRLIVVLGSGCSLSAMGANGARLPTGPELAKSVADEFDIEFDNEPLPEIAQAAYAESPRSDVNKFIANQLFISNVGRLYPRFAKLILPRVYTLNLDLALEEAVRKYSEMRMTVFGKNEPLMPPDQFMAAMQIIKLHGSVDKTHDDFIFSLDEYARAHSNLPLWYDQLAADCLSNTVVFIGSEVAEPILFDAMNRLGAKAEGKLFAVTPNIKGPQKKILLSRHITHIAGTFESLLDAFEADERSKLDGPEIAQRNNPGLRHIIELASKGKAQGKAQQLIAKVRSVRPLPVDANVEREARPGIRSFYEGYKPTFQDITDGVPAYLSQTARLLEATKNAMEKGIHLLFVTGPAGSGKTTSLLDAGRLLSIELGRPAFAMDLDAKDPFEAVEALEELYPDGYFLIFESASEFTQNIVNIANKGVLKAGTILAGERLNAWKKRVSENFSPDQFDLVEIDGISRDDAIAILDKIKRFGPWTLLSKMSEEKRIELFYDKAKKQLLVGLIEATKGRGYTEIIRSDYQNLHSDAERFLVAVIGMGTLQGARMPADVTIRAFGHVFAKTKFYEALSGLDGIVASEQNKLVARHPVYARRLFDSVLSDEERMKVIVAVLRAFAAYGSPVPKNTSRENGKIFKNISNYRFVRDALSNDEARSVAVFREFENTFHSDGAYWLQYGLLLRSFGRDDDAHTMLERSVQAYRPTISNFALHALAHQKFIIAERMERWSEAQILVNEATTILQNLDDYKGFDDQYPIATLARGQIKAALKFSTLAKAREVASGFLPRVQSVKKRSPNNTVLAALEHRILELAATDNYDQSYWNKALIREALPNLGLDD